ncbi:MAG: DUF3035 domain-containing protein [Pseudomonadota bacterium]
MESNTAVLQRLVLASLSLSVGVLAACGPSDPNLMRFSQSGTGPDEFMIVPAKPLEEPPSGAGLPAPTPGQANRADATPNADAIVALGGNPSALERRGVPAADNTLISYAGRYGNQPGIRQTLAVEDIEYRRRNPGRPLERLFGVNTYYDVYESEELNQQNAASRWRAAGVETPASPPPEFAQ